MDYLKSQLDTYRDATQKEPRAKRALIQVLYTVCTLADAIARDVKDKASFDDFFDKCVANKTCKAVKDLNNLGELLSLCKKAVDPVRTDRKEKKKEKKVSAAAGATAAAGAGAIATAAPVVNVIVNNYTGSGGGAGATAADGVARKKRPAAAKETVPAHIRAQIWDHYIGTDVGSTGCPCCNYTQITPFKFEAGHVVSEKTGGRVAVENLVPICAGCNRSMGARNMMEYVGAYYNRGLLLPKNNVFTPILRKDALALMPPVDVEIIKHEHCCAVLPTSKKAIHCEFASDKEALDFVVGQGYNAITFKDGVYHFLKNNKLVFNVAKKPTAEEWAYTSWEIRPRK